MTDYAELHAHSNFSFLDGAAHPAELVHEAVRLGLSALAICDHDGFYGVVHFATAARAMDLPTVLGAELTLGLTRRQNGVADPEGHHLVVLARDPEGYARLSRVISEAQLAGETKGRPQLDLATLADAHDGHWQVLTGCRKGTVAAALMEAGPTAALRALDQLIDAFGRDRVEVELWRHDDPVDVARNDALAELALSRGTGLVATSNAHYATPAGQHLAATLAAVRARRSLDEMDGWLPAGPGAHLRSGPEQARRFARWPGAVARAGELGRALAFDLQLVAPELPPFPVPPGQTDEMAYLRHLVDESPIAARCYGTRSAEKQPGAWAQIDHELAVIEQLGFPGYFLVVWDIVRFCREQGILCQGRGSAANSAVCFALGITSVDAVKHQMLFERFLAPERDGPPDIDVDIESGRREGVIQYVYERHGRHHAAQVANVITYRPRSAVRDAAKALGHSSGAIDAWSKQLGPHGGLRSLAGERDARGHRVHDIPDDVVLLAAELEGLPRHLGVHSGGMVICDRPVVEVCPVEWATAADRSVLQWDKESCEGVGLVKFDLLGLGMLEALHRIFDLVHELSGVRYDLGSIPDDDPAVYDVLCRADTVGVFQVESRAQMATLPRLKPRCFYDLVVEVALIRPGPIQGGSVHPYLERRKAREAAACSGPVPASGSGGSGPGSGAASATEPPPFAAPHPLLEPCLRRTLGVPLFQEQFMQMAIDVAGFSAGEADQLRQAMGAKRSTEKMAALRARFCAGMAERGITGEVADEIFSKMDAFAAFGFPESHAVSFAFLVYASAWLKLHYPAAFCAGLLNSQPMGFWAPRTLVADARRHGVTVHRPHVNRSGVEAGLERDDGRGGPVGRGGDGGMGSGGTSSDDTSSGGMSSDDTSSGGTGSGGMGSGGTSSGVAGPDHPGPAVRLGLASIRTMGVDAAERVVAGRPYRNLEDLARRSGLTQVQLEALATAGATTGLAVRAVAVRAVTDRKAAADSTDSAACETAAANGKALAGQVAGKADATNPRDAAPPNRRHALWAAGALAQSGAAQLPGIVVGADPPPLPTMTATEEVVADLWATGVTTETSLTELVRPELDRRGVVAAAALGDRRHGERVAVAGVVTHRQRPPTANGVTFISLEDETGLVNVVCSGRVWLRHRRVAQSAAAMVVHGRVEAAEGVVNVRAERIEPLELAAPTRSRDFS